MKKCVGIKKILRIAGIVLGAVLLAIIGYLAYVLISYDRIEDHQVLTVSQSENKSMTALAAGNQYSAMTFNIGFGAFEEDYSFFMDGGEYSRAYSKEECIENINGCISIIKREAPDLLLLQEVDTDSTRSYHINQYEMILDSFTTYSAVHALNYDSAYLFYPIFSPHGSAVSGIATISQYQIESTERRSLPIATSLSKFIDLDRCYSISKIPVDNGKYLYLFNAHLSAFTTDDSIVKNQITMLAADMAAAYEAGNYVICGGDFNQDLPGNSPELFHSNDPIPNWAQPFPKELLSDGIEIAYHKLDEASLSALFPSCRNADKPYVAGDSFVTIVDGFIVSNNVLPVSIEVLDERFIYSDHNPVFLTFELQ